MDYLARDSAPFDAALWNQIDSAVIEAAKKILVGRRFLNVYGPLGPGATSINIDNNNKKEEIFEEGIVRTAGRRLAELPQIYNDFWLYWRDIEHTEKDGYPLDLAVAISSAEALARAEDNLVFFGSKALGIDGLLTAGGINKIKRADWKTGENAYQDIAKGLSLLNSKGYIGRYALVLSPDIFLDLQRIQPGTGIMEIDRVKSMLSGRVYYAPVLGTKKAVLLCCEPQYADIAIGQDMAAAYLELVDLNHHFRVLETVAPRVKCPETVVLFE